MTDYIKFWIAKELAALGIIVAIVLLIVGVAAFTTWRDHRAWKKRRKS